MKIKFTKMTGAGNDFIVISSKNFQPESELIQTLCDRHFGVGADGVLIISKSKKADFKVRYFNSDGSGDALCINGARCAVMFAYLNGLSKKNTKFEFINKIFYARIIDRENVQIFLNYAPIIKLNLEVDLEDIILPCHYVDIGSKHLIVKWEVFKSLIKKSILNYELKNIKGSSLNFNDFNIELIGRKLRFHKNFSPDGVNVNFVQKVNEKKFKIRTYERGVEGETLACGSGSISAAIALNNLNKIQPPIILITKSKKELTVDFQKINNEYQNISIIGHTERVFDGVVEK